MSAVTQYQQNTNAGFMDFTRLDTAIKACEMIANSSFCPADFKNKTGDVLCAIQYGMEVGLSPMQALQNIAVINGKPSIYGDALIALCLSFPECEDIQESFDESKMAATCKVKRRGMSWVIKTYSKQDAEIAKLWGKKTYQGKDTPWITYPKRMLQMRARGFALRDAFADRLKGIITVEEARDYPVKEERQLNVVTPIKQNVKVIEQPQAVMPQPKVKEETRNHLKFLVAQCQISQEIINKWFKKANITRFDDFTEQQATLIIDKLEADNFDAKQAWIDFVKVREAYNQQQEGAQTNV
jgi:hypothetical protein